MRISETLNEGLKRGYAVVVPAADLAKKIDEQISSVAHSIRMPGFRPGKVPPSLIRKVHGPALMGQALEQAVQEGSQKILADKQLRPAMQPKIEITKYEEDSDLEFTINLEILPQVASPDLGSLALERWAISVDDAAVDEAVQRLADQQKSFEDAVKTHKAATGDAVIIDFVGKLDGEPFEGGKGEDIQLELGSGMFIPGFEDQLVGAKAGDERTVTVTFPENYQVKYLKGREAVFDVVVKSVKTAKAVTVDDDLAKNLGLESLGALRDILKSQVERDNDALSRTYLKRKLLDALAASHDFDVPESMVEAEFEQIWAQLQREIGDDAEELAKLEADRDEYRGIAVRRVRLGLLLSEIGQAHNVQITQAEMGRLIAQEANKYPGQQAEVAKYFQENPMASAQLRAPLYEEKVVDFILTKATVTDKKVSRDALLKAIQEEEDAEAASSSGKKAPAKAKASKASAEKEQPAKKAAPKAEKAKPEAPEGDKPKAKAPAKTAAKKAK